MFSERLRRLKPYIPGEQPQDRSYLKLNTNENPYPPSPLIGDFLRTFEVENLRLYPDPLFRELREKIGNKVGLDKACVFLGNGSDEVLSFSFFAFFDSSVGPLLFPEHTYSFYPVYCAFYGIDYRKIPLSPDFSIRVDGFLEVQASCGIIFANPNAPTGIFLELDEVRRLLEGFPRDKVVILDEAYVAFGGESAASLIRDFSNLLIVGTFSKSMCLAGQRLGYALGHRDLIDALFTVKDSFNSYPMDVLSLKIGALAVSDENYYQEITNRIIATRDYFARALEEKGWRVLPSMANFVFASKKGNPGKEIYLRLKENGILVRYFDIPGIQDFVRITIGRPEDMERFLQMVETLF